MFPLSYRSRQLKSRHRPEFDLLESRIALAVGGGSGRYRGNRSPGWHDRGGREPDQDAPLSVDLIDPVPGSVLTASPPSLVLEFNRPIIPDYGVPARC